MTALLYRPAVDSAAAERIPLFVVTVGVGFADIVVDTFVLNKYVTEVRESLSVDKVGLRIADVSLFGSVDVYVSVITTVVVCVTVVTGKLVVKVEFCTDVQTCVTVDDCLKVNDWT